MRLDHQTKVLPKRGTLQPFVYSCKPNQETYRGDLVRKQEERSLIDKAVDNLWVKRSYKEKELGQDRYRGALGKMNR